jgi:hypothetical protein
MVAILRSDELIGDDHIIEKARVAEFQLGTKHNYV